MKALVVEDEASSRITMCRMLESFGYVVVSAADGSEALTVFMHERPDFVVTDWMMPGMDGITVVKTIRAFAESEYTYIIMVTSREAKDDILEGMQAGVDEFLVKPVDREELRARMRVGRRILTLQETLRQRIREVEEANAHVKTLQGFLPICAYCKNVRNEEHLWEEVEKYISAHESAVKFSHSICPSCYEQHVKPMQDKFFAEREAQS